MFYFNQRRLLDAKVAARGTVYPAGDPNGCASAPAAALAMCARDGTRAVRRILRHGARGL